MSSLVVLDTDSVLESLLDLREYGPDRRAEQDENGDDNDGDQRDDQGIFHEALTLAALEQTIEHVFRPFDDERDNPAATPPA